MCTVLTFSPEQSQTVSQIQASNRTFEYRIFNPNRQPYQMPSIWQLVAGNLAANGDVHPENAMAAAKDAVFDTSELTRVVSIFHESGRLAGTFSYTLDSEKDGMPVSHHFQDELSFLRLRYRLVNGWRFSMSPLYQSAVLRQRTMALFKKLVQVSESDGFVIYYNQRLDAYYQRLFNGRIVATKSISFDGHAELPVSMMVCETADNTPDPKFLSDGVLYDDALVREGGF